MWNLLNVTKNGKGRFDKANLEALFAEKETSTKS